MDSAVRKSAAIFPTRRNTSIATISDARSHDASCVLHFRSRPKIYINAGEHSENVCGSPLPLRLLTESKSGEGWSNCQFNGISVQHGDFR